MLVASVTVCFALQARARGNPASCPKLGSFQRTSGQEEAEKAEHLCGCELCQRA